MTCKICAKPANQIAVCGIVHYMLELVCGLLYCICQVFYLDGQIAVFAGGGQLLDVSVHLRHGQAACALLAAAEDALQPRQNPLQLRVQVTAVIWKNTHLGQPGNFSSRKLHSRSILAEPFINKAPKILRITGELTSQLFLQHSNELKGGSKQRLLLKSF